MKLFRILLTCTLIGTFLSISTGYAQQNTGGRGLMYVHSARAIGKGYLNSYFHSRFFGKVGTREGGAAVGYWDVQGSFTLNYGFTDKLEASLFPIVYQDTNRGDPGWNLPGDLFLKLKIGSLGPQDSKFKYGVMVSSRFPIGDKHNLIYEPYSAGTVEVGFTGMASYADDLLYPNKSFNGHLNLGYIFHNDAGNTLTDSPQDTISNKSITSEGIFGLGVRIPFDKWDVTLEVNGNIFIQNPAVTAYARENYLFFTPGVSYKIFKWFHIDFACDFRLTGDKDETDYVFGINKLPRQLPTSYPDWRAHLAMKFAILPSSLYRDSERDLLLRKAETRREIFEQIVRERRETEEAEKELERIKQERRKAEQELMRLRKLLEGKNPEEEKKSNNDKKDKKEKKKEKKSE